MEELISQLKALPPLKQKLATALVSVIVADAAGEVIMLPSQSTHWVYNDSVMQKVTATNGPEFVSPSPNPFYSLPVGSQSFYGDQTLVLLKSLAKCKGLDMKDYGDSYMTAFGPGSSYDVPNTNTKPIQGPWRSSGMKRFVFELYPKGQTGADLDDDSSDDPGCLMMSLPIILCYYGTSELDSKVDKSFSLLLSNEVCRSAVSAFMKLLEFYINGETSDSEKNIQLLSEELRKSRDPDVKAYSSLVNQVLASKSMSVKDITAKFSKA